MTIQYYRAGLDAIGGANGLDEDNYFCQLMTARMAVRELGLSVEHAAEAYGVEAADILEALRNDPLAKPAK